MIEPILWGLIDLLDIFALIFVYFDQICLVLFFLLIARFIVGWIILPRLEVLHTEYKRYKEEKDK